LAREERLMVLKEEEEEEGRGIEWRDEVEKTSLWNLSELWFVYLSNPPARVAEHALHRTATHCNTPQHTTPHCNALQRTATHWQRLVGTPNCDISFAKEPNNFGQKKPRN